jgi:hypothetical protein
MNRTYNHASFRHPVFGRGSVVQSGVEWFYKPIEKVAPEFEAAVVRAIEESNEEIAGS